MDAGKWHLIVVDDEPWLYRDGQPAIVSGDAIDAHINALQERAEGLEKALRRTLAVDAGMGRPGWVAYNHFGAHCCFCGEDVRDAYDEALIHCDHDAACAIGYARALTAPDHPATNVEE